jgi:hypothetical protein
MIGPEPSVLVEDPYRFYLLRPESKNMYCHPLQNARLFVSKSEEVVAELGQNDIARLLLTTGMVRSEAFDSLEGWEGNKGARNEEHRSI